jgi:phosphomannomutase
MDLSYALGRRLGADLVLANDPDADRLSVAVADATSPSSFRQLTGNEVGVLLGNYLLMERTVARERLVLASIVSSPLLGHIAKALGARYEETLTGFKWIANRAMELEKADGVEFVFGYEEALGYTVGDVVRDKDGVSAAVLAAEIAAVLRAQGKRTLLDELETIHRRYGLFVSSQLNVTRKGAAGIADIRAIMERLRAAKPAKIGPFDVDAVSDYEAGTRTATGGAVTPLTLPKSNVLTFDLAGGSRVIARPSGTEPKLKIYFDVREAVRQGEPMADAEGRARAAMDAVATAVKGLAGVG